MRTKITLDDGLVRRLKDEMQARGTGFRETLEEILGRGLANKAANSGTETFRVRARPMRLRAGIDPSRLHDFETDLEVDRFLSVTRKQQERQCNNPETEFRGYVASRGLRGLAYAITPKQSFEATWPRGDYVASLVKAGYIACHPIP